MIEEFDRKDFNVFEWFELWDINVLAFRNVEENTV